MTAKEYSNILYMYDRRKTILKEGSISKIETLLEKSKIAKLATIETWNDIHLYRSVKKVLSAVPHSCLDLSLIHFKIYS